MRFDDVAPLPAVVVETTKRTPVPEARANATVPAIIGITSGVVTAGAVGLVALALEWPADVVAVAAGVGTVIGLWVGFGILPQLMLATEESTQYSEAQPALTQAVNWEMPVGPHQLERGTLIADPALVVEWAIAAVGQASISYATWGERFGGERQYARFRKRLVESGLAVEQGRELMLTLKGRALFSQVAERGREATPLLSRSALLRPPDGSETREAREGMT